VAISGILAYILALSLARADAQTLVLLASAIWASSVFLSGVGSRGLGRVLAEHVGLGVTLCSMTVMIGSTSMLGVVFGFELMLLGAILMFFLTIKDERGVEAGLEMYVWAVIGSAMFILALAING